MRKEEELKEIIRLITWWITDIKANNYNAFFDINKVAEDLSVKLLNEIYGYDLENLNYEKSNYPGIDLGDKTNRIGFQISSRKDSRKFKDSLEKFVTGPDKVYTRGIRFLVLTQEKKPKLDDNKLKAIYPKFIPDEHILTANDLIVEINRFYDNDRQRFFRIKNILQNELGIKIGAAQGNKQVGQYEAFRNLLARYWQLSISLTTIAVTWIVSSFGTELTITEKILITLLAFIIVTGFIRSPKLAYRVTRRLFGNPKPVIYKRGVFRGAEPYLKGEKLPGRHQEIALCLKKIRKNSFFILEGESGCGKSSLLNAGLIQLLEDDFDIIEMYVGKDLIPKLKKVKTAPNSNPVLFIVDQFEELFTNFVERERLSLFKLFYEILSNSNVKIVISIRSDFRDLLDKLCREVDPAQQQLDLGSYYHLKAFNKTDSEAVLKELLITPDIPLTSLQELKLSQFITSLVKELLRAPRDVRLCPYDEETVLPVELQIIGLMIESLGTTNFDPDRIKELGGKKGLMTAYLDETTSIACKKSGLPQTDVFFILKEFVSEKGLRKVQSMKNICKTLSLNLREVQLCLGAFQETFLIKEIVDESKSKKPDAPGNLQESNEDKWFTPIHDYIGRLILETQDPLLKKTIDMESKVRFWVDHANQESERKKGALRLISHSIPTMEAFRLFPWAKNEDDRRVIFRNIRIISVKIIMALFILSVPFFWISHISEYAQTFSTRMAINKALDINKVNRAKLGVHLNSDLCYVWFQPFQCGKIFHISSNNSVLASGKFSRFDFILSTLENSEKKRRWYLDRRHLEGIRDKAIFNKLLFEKSGMEEKLFFPLRPNASIEKLRDDVYIQFADDNKGIFVSGSIARLFAEYKLEAFIGLPLSNHFPSTPVISRFENGYAIGAAPNENKGEVQVIYILIREGMSGNFEWGYYQRFDQFPFGYQFFKINWVAEKNKKSNDYKSAPQIFREKNK